MNVEVSPPTPFVTARWVAVALALLSSCASPGEDSYVLEPGRCFDDGDCADEPDTPVCNVDTARCETDEPCTSDVLNEYVCVEGERLRCRVDPTLDCTVCLGACGETHYCASEAEGCVPRKDDAEPCEAHGECRGGYCNMGACAGDLTEVCNPDTCDGGCLYERDSESSYCVRRCGGCSDGDAGRPWRCVRLRRDSGSVSYCVPIENRCLRDSHCTTFENGSCQTACSPSECFDYCQPDEIAP